jgi:hypothetical protein
MTLASLIVISNFPDPDHFGSTKSLLAYSIAQSNWLLPLLTLLPLGASLALTIFPRLRSLRIFAIPLVTLSICGYIYALIVFEDTGVESQPLIEDLASVLQPVFFFIVAPIYAFLNASDTFNRIKLPSHKLDQRERGWLLKVRDYIFPSISEINYAIFFVAVVLVVWQNPAPILELIFEDIRSVIFVGMSIYLFIYMLTPRKLSHDNKMWTMFIYNALIGGVSAVALVGQLEAGVAGEGLIHQANLFITIVVLIVSGIRFLAAGVIFRMDDGSNGKVMADRFSNHQHKLTEFAMVILLVGGIMWFLRQFYEPNEVLLLLTFAYASTIYEHLIKHVYPISSSTVTR